MPSPLKPESAYHSPHISARKDGTPVGIGWLPKQGDELVIQVFCTTRGEVDADSVYVKTRDDIRALRDLCNKLLG